MRTRSRVATVSPIRLPAAQRVAGGLLELLLVAALFVGAAGALRVALHRDHAPGTSCIKSR